MCGIAGHLGAPDLDQTLDRMLDAIRHRGPDGRGTHSDTEAQIGQVRLSIIDLAGGRQPIANEDESLWIVCNGEIYNYQSLRTALLVRGHRFRTSSDTEVILHLYEEYGERCVEHLRGMFSFVIWDRREQRFFAARDHLGQKPFYYALVGSDFYFASEIKAILAARPDLRRMDPKALDQYLALRFIAAPASMFEQVKKLPPGHTLSIDAALNLKIESYWQLSYEPKHTMTVDNALEELQSLLLETLEHHMVSDVPVGALLSGGLDSGLVVAMLCKHLVRDQLQTFTLGLKHGRFDEAPAARLVAEQYGTLHREDSVNPSMIDKLPDLIWHLDEPSDSLSLCNWLIADLASKHVKVVVGGDGGDELFGGYDRYSGYTFADRYAYIPKIFRQYVLGPLLSSLSTGHWYKSRVHQLRWLHYLASTRGGDRYAAALGYFYFDAAGRESIYGERMSASLDGYDATAFVKHHFETARANHPVDRMLSTDLKARLPDHPVMITDRMTMAHGLEARSPLMDHKLAEFCARLPVSLKVKGRSLRILQTKLAKKYLPPEVVSRPKQGFASALPYMLRAEYPRLFRAVLTDSRLVHDGYFRAPAIDRLLEQHLTGKADHANRLWQLSSSEVWYRMAIKGESRDVPIEQYRE